jgi:RNA-directed DNA polymerase
VFNNVFHLIDRDFLREAYRQTHKSSAPGMDQVTAQQYAENLDENLRDLHERLRGNRYVAPPVERVWIERPRSWDRPLDSHEAPSKMSDAPPSKVEPRGRPRHP